MAEPTDIGKLASLARTAITDPGAMSEQYPTHRPSSDQGGWIAYAVARLDEIIGVTDPVDDEQEFGRCADSLDALGRAIERIREQFEKAANDRGTASDTRMHVLIANDRIPDALDKLDEAVSALREAQEAQIDADLHCEDCAVNGDDCREHGEAWKIARRAVRENPARVLALLREEVQL